MAEFKQIYKCEGTGVMVEVLRKGHGVLVSDGKEMELLDENTTDAATEKHVPVVEKTEDGVIVKVGAVEHPMQDTHYIEWIELHAGDYVYRRHLKPGDKPEALFKGVKIEDVDYAREYCNLHGLWRTVK